MGVTGRDTASRAVTCSQFLSQPEAEGSLPPHWPPAGSTPELLAAAAGLREGMVEALGRLAPLAAWLHGLYDALDKALGEFFAAAEASVCRPTAPTGDPVHDSSPSHIPCAQRRWAAAPWPTPPNQPPR